MVVCEVGGDGRRSDCELRFMKLLHALAAGHEWIGSWEMCVRMRMRFSIFSLSRLIVVGMDKTSVCRHASVCRKGK